MAKKETDQIYIHQSQDEELTLIGDRKALDEAIKGLSEDENLLSVEVEDGDIIYEVTKKFTLSLSPKLQEFKEPKKKAQSNGKSTGKQKGNKSKT